HCAFAGRRCGSLVEPMARMETPASPRMDRQRRSSAAARRTRDVVGKTQRCGPCPDVVQAIADQGRTGTPRKRSIDRLCKARSPNLRRQENVAAILVDAGSAVTIDYIDSAGAFRGGAIFPGFRLMAQALHDHTALLPLVEMDEAILPPGTSTIHA